MITHWIIGSMWNMGKMGWSSLFGVRLKEQHQFQRKKPLSVLSEAETCDLIRNVSGCRTGVDKVGRVRYSVYTVQCYFLCQNGSN